MKPNELIEVDPEKMSGTPVFTGTRVPINHLFDYLEVGDSLDEFLSDFPTVKREQALGVLEATSLSRCLFVVAVESGPGSTPDYAKEPLLQHYGIHTRWLDLIDNVWIGLWFACHRAVTIGAKSEYLHFEKRSIASDSNPYAYVLLIQTGPVSPDPMKPGLSVSKSARLIDLRVAIVFATTRTTRIIDAPARDK